MAEDRRRKLYDLLSGSGYNVGDYNEYYNAMNDEGRRRKFYDLVSSSGYNLGSREDFEAAMASPSETPDYFRQARNAVAEAQKAIDDYDAENRSFMEGYELRRDNLARYGGDLPREQEDRLRSSVDADTPKYEEIKAGRAELQAARDNIPEYAILRHDKDGRAANEYVQAYNDMVAARKALDEYDANAGKAGEEEPLTGNAANDITSRYNRAGRASVEKSRLEKRLSDARERYYSSPITLALNEEGAAAAEDANREIARLRTEMSDRVKYVPQAGGALPPERVTDDKYGYEEMLLSDADQLNRETAALYRAPSKYDGVKGVKGFGKGLGSFGKGAAHTLSDPDFWTMGLSELASSLNANQLWDKIREKLGTANLTEEKIEEVLTPSEQSFIEAFFRNADAQAARSEDLSKAYQAGESATDSLMFMAEFALTGGASRSALDSFGKFLGKKLGKTAVGEAAAKVASNRIGRAAGKAARATVESAMMTAMQPGTYAQMIDAANGLEYDEATGGLEFADSGKQRWNALLDAGIENLSEMAGGPIDKVLGLPFKAVKAGARKVGLGSFADMVERFSRSPQISALKAGGWHGFIGETGEELFGAGLRQALGVDDNAVKDFFDKDNLEILTMSFLPLTLFGGTMSTARYAKTVKGYENGRENVLQDLSGLGISTDGVVSDMRGVKSLDEAASVMHDTLLEMADAKAAPKQMQRFVDYAKTAVQLSFGDEAGRFQEDSAYDALGAELESSLGQPFWRDENTTDGDGRPAVERIVERITDTSGKQGYVLGNAEDGTATVLYDDGAKGFAQPSDIVETSRMGYREYLAGLVEERRRDDENSRMQVESNDNIIALQERLPLGSVVNVGTLDNKVEGVVREWTPDGIIVETADGARPYTYEEAQALPLYDDSQAPQPTPVLTDEQIDEEQVKTLDGADARSVYLKWMRNADVEYIAEDGTRKNGRIVTAYTNDDTMTPSVRVLREDGTEVSVDEAAIVSIDGKGVDEAIDEASRDLPPDFATESDMRVLAEAGIGQPDGDVVNTREALPSNSSDGHLAESQNEMPDLLPAQENNASSAGEGGENSITSNTPETESSVNAPEQGAGLVLKSDGAVDETATWNASPASWAQWNDQKRQDGGANSEAYVNAALGAVAKEGKELGKAYARELDFERRNALEQKLSANTRRQEELSSILEGYRTRREQEERARKEAEREARRREEQEAKASEERERSRLREPQTLEQLVANALHVGGLRGQLNREDFRRELGWGPRELAKFFPYWAKKGEGMSVAALAESIAQDDEYGYLVPKWPGTENPDDSAVRDVILSLFGSASGPGEFTRYTEEENRDAEERRMQEEQDEADRYFHENFGMDEAEFTERYGKAAEDEGLNLYEYAEKMMAENGDKEANVPYAKLDDIRYEDSSSRTANLSPDKTDEYGKPFILAKDGTATFGMVDSESGLMEAPIQLSLGENYVGEDGKNHGYGLLHIEAGHGEQIRDAGFSSVEEFVEEVAKNYADIREGAKIGDKQTYLLEMADGHNNTLFVQLSKDGTYWNVNSAGIFNVKYSRRKQKVYSVPALGEDTDTDTFEVNSGHSEGATAPAGNSSETSENKGNETSGNAKESDLEKELREHHLRLLELFGLIPEEKVSSPEEISDNVEKLVSGLVQHEAELGDIHSPYSSLGGYAYGGKYMRNAFEQVKAHLMAIKHDNGPLVAEWLKSVGIADMDALDKYVEKLYDRAKESQLNAHKTAAAIQEARMEVDPNPSEAQKESGNYKKGHIRLDGYDITLENPKGSTRSGVDRNGKEWHTEMNNDYGYIRGTESVDGDHIDVFLSDSPSEGKVYVVDQVSPDTGEFDEHKVMYGFNSEEEARKAYLSNYSEGWKGLGNITEVSKEEFRKWIDSSHRKTKPFAEYRSVKTARTGAQGNAENIGHPLTEKEAASLIVQMEDHAEPAEEMELTPENWAAQFGEDGVVETPLGNVKMGENQYYKLARQGRSGKLGMVKPTLTNPDVVIMDNEEDAKDKHDRNYAYVFVKTFVKGDGSRFYYFTSVTVDVDNHEVVISNQEKSRNRISKLLQKGNVTWIDNAFSLHPTAQTEESVPLDDSSRLTRSDNQPAKLGINSSESDSSGNKGNENSEGNNIRPDNLSDERQAEREGGAQKIVRIRNGKNFAVATNLRERFADLYYLYDFKEGGPVNGSVDEETGNVTIDKDSEPELTAERRLAYESVRQMLSDAGIPVEELSGKAMEQLAEGTDAVLSRRKSPRARWSDSYADVMRRLYGVNEKVSRGNLAEMEARARRDAKELYGRVLSGNFDELTLQKIDEYIDNATNRNRFLRPLSQRLPERALLSLSEDDRTAAVDALFSRICESAVPANGRTRAEGRRKIEARKEELLEAWAKATGNWNESIADFTKETEPIRSGTDSDVYLSDDGTKVIKASKGKFDNRKFPTDIDQVPLFNSVFPGSAYRILGYGRLDGKFVRFLEQPFVDFSTAAPLSTEERTDYMRSLGFRPLNEEKTLFSNGEVVVSDLQKANIVKGSDGNIWVIDADVKLHTKDIGGQYAYPPVETDTDTPEEVSLHTAMNNVDSALSALKSISEGENEVKNAMFRDDLESYGGTNEIAFVWGNPGNAEKSYKGGSGISHILSKHGKSTLIKLIDVIADGDVKRYVAGNKTVVLEKDGYEAVLALTRFGDKQSWLLSGWNTNREEEKEQTDGDGEVRATSIPTQESPTFSRADLGAVVSDAKVRKEIENSITTNAEETPELMTVYHGSGARFDRFDHSHMGEGEGAQAYGWGTYVTEVEGIGRAYAADNAKKLFAQFVLQKSAEKMRNAMADGKTFEEAKREVQERLRPEYEKSKKARNGLDYSEFIADYEKLEHLTEDEFKVGNLYTVDIPDNTGDNYLDWDGKLTTAQKGVIFKALKRLKIELADWERRGFSLDDKGKDVHQFLSYALRHTKKWEDENALRAVSKFLSSLGFTGIKYPAQFRSGGREDDASNYVIFNENDLKIVDRINFLRNGATVYGAAVGGKIFLNAERLNPNTPVHEYTHLWDRAVQRKNPELWKRGVELMKQTALWQEVENDPNYAGLDENGIAGEVHSRLAGDKGEAELERMSREVLESNAGITDKARRFSVISRLRKWLSEFWHWVKDTMTPWSREEAAKVSLEDFVNMPLADLAKGTRFDESQLNTEERDIVKRAKADGTYMKAPNGKPTNLNERQWAQVRTKAFKDWFGDWELKAKVFNVVPASKQHGFKDFEEAKAWAKDNVVRTLSNEETGGKGEIRISGASVKKFLSESSVVKSDSRDVHLSVLKVLPDVIRESVDAEQHPDYKKGEDGKRKADNPVNGNVAIHRLYGAVGIDGRVYRVKVTVKEDRTNAEAKKAYNYEATKIELLAGQNEEAVTSSRNSNNSISAANLLKGVEKSYGTGEKLLDSSKVVDENGEPRAVYHYTNKDFSVFRKDNVGENTFDNASDVNYASTAAIGHWFTSRNDLPSYMGKPMMCFLNMRNAMDMGSLAGLADTMASFVSEDAAAAFENDYDYSGIVKAGKAFVADAASNGYDGVIIEDEEFGGTSWVAFSENQIKSATSNTGEFSTEDNDIRFHIVTDEKGNRVERKSPDDIASMETPVLKSKGTFKNLKEAEQWAKENLQGREFRNQHTQSLISISGKSIKEMLAEKFAKTASVDAHMAALQSVPDFIETGIPAETHSDTHGRGFDVMRLYSAFENSGKVYRVKSTIKKLKEGDRYYTYELQEMELIEETQINSAVGLDGNPVLNSINSITGAKLLKGVKKTNSEDYILPEIEGLPSYTPAEVKQTVRDYIEDALAENDMDARVLGIELIGSRMRGNAREDSDLDAVVEYEGSEREDDMFNILHDEDSPLEIGGVRVDINPIRKEETGTLENYMKRSAEYDREALSGARPEDAVRFRSGDFLNGLETTDDVYDALTEHASPKEAWELMDALESFYEGKVRSASQGAKMAVESEGLLPFPDGKFSGLDGEYHHIMFETEDGETVVRPVPFDEAEKVLARINDGSLKKVWSGERRWRANELEEVNKEKGADIPALRETAEAVSSKLGVQVQFVSPDEIPQGRRDARGYWRDGKIYVCLENHADAADVARTVLHEAVGHNGLRRLVGDANMDSFCRELYRALPKEERRAIAESIGRNGMGLSEAVEEYLARKAETFDADAAEQESLWDRIRSSVRRLLSKIGILVPVTQRDVRWILWQSANANRWNDARVNVQRARLAHKLGFSAYAQRLSGEARRSIRYRGSDERLAETAAAAYNRAATLWSNRLKESFVDMLTSVEDLQHAVEKESGKKAAPFENAVLAFNQMSSKGQARMLDWERRYWTPLAEAVLDVARKVSNGDKDVVERYVMLKHGLERNEEFAKRDARNAYRKKYEDRLRRINENGALTKEEKEAAKSKLDSWLEARIAKVDAGTDVLYKENRERDYSGLTGLYTQYDDSAFDPSTETREEYLQRRRASAYNGYETLAEMESAAKKEVEEFEKKAGDDFVDGLWSRINGATKSTLRMQYEYGLISKDTYDKLKDQFRYYVPLRGFSEETASDLYSYLSKSEKGRVAGLERAKGRTSEATSPFGFIGEMASVAVTAGVKNEAKKALYYFALNRGGNTVLKTSDVWYVQKTDAAGNVETDDDGRAIYEPAYPEITGDTLDEADRSFNDYVEKMKELHAAGKAFRSSRKPNLNYVIHATPQQEGAHVVKFKLNGAEKMLFVRGNPRAAQAINGELNMEVTDNVFARYLSGGLRYLGWVSTAGNPAFWVSNFQRDLLMSVLSTQIKENGEYQKNFRRNLWKVAGVMKMGKALREGRLGGSYLEKMYREFSENGGVTGYSVLKKQEEWENGLKGLQTKDIKVVNALQKGFTAFMEFGEGIEQMTRFAAFVTSREMGKPMRDAISDAKELTVNFNRKGGGGLITAEEASKLTHRNGRPLNGVEQKLVQGLSLISPLGRHAILFFNAAVQGLNTVYRLARKNPKKLGAILGGYAMLGFVNAMMNALLDDDDDYLDVPDYERRNNMLLGADGVYFKWALPQEVRMFYALGDVAANRILGREPHRAGFKSTTAELSEIMLDVLPLNPTDGLVKAVTPTLLTPWVEIAMNEDYKGTPIYNDMAYLSDEEKARTPKFKMAYASTPKVFVDLSKMLNDISGGDETTAGLVNINPAAVEHLVTSYTGGVGRTLEQAYCSSLGLLFGEEPSVRNTPVLSRLLTISDERYRNSHLDDLYKYYKAEAEHFKKRLNAYAKEGDSSKVDELTGSGDFEIYRIYRSYERIFDYYRDRMKLAEDSERKQLMQEQDEYRRKMINEIADIK